MINKVMTWVVIMALIVSQSYAYASVPCESSGDMPSQHHNDMDVMMMEHSLPEHDMPSHMQQEKQKNLLQPSLSMDCCDEECSCPTGTYSSATLMHSITVAPLRLVADSSRFYLFLLQETFLPSLRKPPIIG
jgi:hypothetical protein